MRNLLLSLFLFSSFLCSAQTDTLVRSAVSSSATFKEIILKHDSVLRWSIEDDTMYRFTVQQFRWNRWVNFDVIKSTGAGEYAVDIRRLLHSGMNQFRVAAKRGSKTDAI